MFTPNGMHPGFDLTNTQLYAMCFGSAFVGPIFFWIPASTEIFAAAVGRQGLSAPLVGLMCATGQCALFTLVFHFGQQLASRWRWLGNTLARATASKHARLLQRGGLAATVGATLVGIPPTIPLFTLASSIGMRLPPMLLIAFPGRFARFALICFLASAATHWGEGAAQSSAPLWPDAASLLRWTLQAQPADGRRGAAALAEQRARAVSAAAAAAAARLGGSAALRNATSATAALGLRNATAALSAVT